MIWFSGTKKGVYSAITELLSRHGHMCACAHTHENIRSHCINSKIEKLNNSLDVV